MQLASAIIIWPPAQPLGWLQADKNERYRHGFWKLLLRFPWLFKDTIVGLITGSCVPSHSLIYKCTAFIDNDDAYDLLS